VALAGDVVAVGAVAATYVAIVEVSALRGIAVGGVDRLADLGGGVECVSGSTGCAVCVSAAERRLFAADAGAAVECLVPGARSALVGAVGREAHALVAFALVVEFKQVPALRTLSGAVGGSAESERSQVYYALANLVGLEVVFAFQALSILAVLVPATRRVDLAGVWVVLANIEPLVTILAHASAVVVVRAVVWLGDLAATLRVRTDSTEAFDAFGVMA
jgi:hypothetical protein